MQKIAIGAISGTGIVAVLIIAGMGLEGFKMPFGELAIGAGVLIGIVFGILGIIGILSRYL